MTSPPASDDTMRRLKADQESLLPGLAYAGAAAIGGAVLVNHARSMPVKILTPLAMATLTGAYFLPAHTELLKSTWTPSMLSRKVRAGESPMSVSSMNDSMSSSNTMASDMPQGSMVMDQISRQQQQQQNAGKEQAKSWLDPWRLDSDKNLRAEGVQSKFHDTSMNQSIPENPSSSRWSWWKRSDSMTPKSEMDTKVQIHSQEPTTLASSSSSPPSSLTSERVESSPPTSTTTITTTMTTTMDPDTVAAADESVSSQQQQQQQRRGSMKPRTIVVDKAVASAAIKGHDDVINRDSWMGKNTEETARKVHDNVVDAALPKNRQSRHEKHPIEVSRQASRSDMRDGQFIVREPQDNDAPPERVRRKSLKNNLHHGLENQEKRSSMIFKGVENLEHSINKRIQKALEDEAEFWHQESMKEQANARGGERGM